MSNLDSTNKVLAVVSGGMDSVTLAYHLKDAGYDLALVSFDYGQRHAKELDYAAKCAEALAVPHQIIDMSFMHTLLDTSSLTNSEIDVPDGHYAEESMKATVVPNRNMIMLSIAAGIAVANNAAQVATGVHAGDHTIYPDCRPEFIERMNWAVKAATEGFSKFHLVDNAIFAPFVNISKADIVRIGAEIEVPYQDTWSCYKGGEIHCGRCGTCVERKEAFRLAEVVDPTEYEDPEFEVPAYSQEYLDARAEAPESGSAGLTVAGDQPGDVSIDVVQLP